MDRNFLDKVMEFGQHLESANRQYVELKESVAQMMEENHALQIENHHLRNRLEEIEKQLNVAIDWYRFDDGHYVVYTTSDADKWYGRLQSLVKPEGSVFICKLEKDDSNGWMQKSFWDWYRKPR